MRNEWIDQVFKLRYVKYMYFAVGLLLFIILIAVRHYADSYFRVSPRII